MQENTPFEIHGVRGVCGSLPVFMGCAQAKKLHAHSFADVLNEDTGLGYQRVRNIPHSKNFRSYIHQERTSTIALTFNLRGEPGAQWSIEDATCGAPFCVLKIKHGQRPLAQVDCQHRLGELDNSEIPLAFMAFLGLELRSEMAMFNVINTRAKGLTSSLTDYHESNLVNDMATDAPHLYIARRLNEDRESPWFRLIKYGGETSSGLKRRVSLRMMQTTVRRFLHATDGVLLGDIEAKYLVLRSFWLAIRALFVPEWEAPRTHLLMKGVGLYSLSYLLADLVTKHHDTTHPLQMADFITLLAPLRAKTDWSSDGPFSTAGGRKGAIAVYKRLKEAMGI